MKQNYEIIDRSNPFYGAQYIFKCLICGNELSNKTYMDSHIGGLKCKTRALTQEMEAKGWVRIHNKYRKAIKKTSIPYLEKTVGKNKAYRQTGVVVMFVSRNIKNIITLYEDHKGYAGMSLVNWLQKMCSRQP